MSKGKILVADDEPEIVRSVSLRLKSVGYEVVTAMDGMQATNMAMKEEPDLIILDIGMPAGSGHVVVERLQNSAKTCDIPIVFLSARTAIEDFEKASEKGVKWYITKPFKSEELLLIVDKILESKLV